MNQDCAALKTSETANTEFILNNSDNKPVIKALIKFQTVLKKYGINIAAYSERSLIRLAELCAAEKERIRRQYMVSYSIMSEGLQGATESFSSAAETEVKLTKFALKLNGYTASEEFWKTIEDDHIVEIYGPNMKQVYRGINFYKYSKYSLLDIAAFEWFVLWERPTMIVDMMAKQVHHVLENDLGLNRVNLPKHVLRETLNTGMSEGFAPSASIAEFLYLGALKGHKKAPPTGFICTSRGEVIAQGAEALDIEFV